MNHHTLYPARPVAPSLPKLPPEIRFDPIECPSEVIDQTNALEGRTGAHILEPAEQAIDRIRTTRHVSPSHLDSWTRHPDERVTIALLTSDIVRNSPSVARYILPDIVPRAIQKAQERGEIWTPVLDALSSSIWFMAPSVNQSSEILYLETAVGPWIMKQTDTAVVHNVIQRTKSRALIGYIAESTPIIDRAMIMAVLDAHPETIVDFVNNDHLPPELQEELLDRVIIMATQITESSVTDRHLTFACHKLAQRGINLRSDHIRSLINLFKNRSSHRSLNILTQYAHDSGDEEIALQVLEMAGRMDTPDWAVKLIDDSNLAQSRLELTPRLARAALAHCSTFDAVLEIVARSADLRQDPDIRGRLLESADPAVLVSLAQDDRPEEFPLLFKRLATKRPDLAFVLLKKSQETARRMLSQTDLLPLLQAPSHEVRLGTLTMLGEFRERPEEGLTPITQRRSA